MDKKTFYVRVESGEILEDETALDPEFVIEASAEEVNHLRTLFDKLSSKSVETFIDGHVPTKFDEVVVDNQDYDHILHQVYKTIYALGKPQTRSDIEEMGILH